MPLRLTNTSVRVNAMKKVTLFAVSLLALAIFVPVVSVNASVADTLINGGSQQQPFQTNPYNQGLSELEVPNSYATQSRDPYTLIGRIIRIALSFLGVGATALMVYAGVMWMTAAGNDEKVSEAKKTLRNALIGLILIMMSYSLTWYVVSRLQRATNTYGAGTGSGSVVGEDSNEQPGPRRGFF